MNNIEDIKIILNRFLKSKTDKIKSLRIVVVPKIITVLALPLSKYKS
jgi:hypothetical protein